MLVREDEVGDEDERSTWEAAVGAGGDLGGVLNFPLLSVGFTKTLNGGISVLVREGEDEDGRDT